MQIRIGNKQDEVSARALASAAYKGGADLDLSGADNDLRNIETYCFSRDGVFLVAEEERKVIAFASAAKKNDEVLRLHRLVVAEETRRRGIGAQLMRKVLGFARDSDYKSVVADATASPERDSTLAGQFLTRLGFSRAESHYELKLS